MESTANSPKQARYAGAKTLETLPSEIKVMILCHMPSLSSLSSIVHASPTYYQAYLIAREEILHNITIQTLRRNDIGLLDPWTAIHIPQLDHYNPLCTQMIREYLESYARGRINSGRRRLAPQDSLAILSLHKKFTVLIAKYCKVQFSKNPFTEAAEIDPLPPSQSELRRLYRALWRYEIYGQLFGLNKDTSGCGSSMTGNDSVIGIQHLGDPGYTYSAVEIAREFFGLFPIHEVEEVACLCSCYLPLISWELDQLVELGPEQLYQIATAASGDEREAHVAEARKAERVHITMVRALHVYEGKIGWLSKGMYDSFVSEQDPTTGWLWASSHGVQNIDYRMRRWGYVFWNRERLDGWGITQEHMVNWPSTCHGKLIH